MVRELIFVVAVLAGACTVDRRSPELLEMQSAVTKTIKDQTAANVTVELAPTRKNPHRVIIRVRGVDRLSDLPAIERIAVAILSKRGYSMAAIEAVQ